MIRSDLSKVDIPPRTHTSSGSQRRVGVEIEFAGLRAEAVANLVSDHYGGTISMEDPHRFRIETSLGDFIAELDLQYAHADNEQPGFIAESLQEMGLDVPTAIGDLSEGIAPCEVVSPPLAVTDLPGFDDLVTRLVHAGAKGTEDNLVYAFGLHLNPEVADTGAPYLLNMLRAYMLMADWLREEAKQDFTRTVLAFARPFPKAYIDYLLNSVYDPTVETLIDDYLRFNNTRNRELDCLPLFSHIDRDRVLQVVQDKRVKARPTFHYRLPDARFKDNPGLVCREWNRWVAVERLSENPGKIDTLTTAYFHTSSALIPESWMEEMKKWL